MTITAHARHVLEVLAKHGASGPAHLSGLVWPDREIALRKGAAPGTGLVRPMLATLARLKKKDLVRWFSPNGTDPIKWEITYRGRRELGLPIRAEIDG